MLKEQIDELSAIQLNPEKCVPFSFPLFNFLLSILATPEY